MKKTKKEKYHDDGRTIYNMDVDGMPHRVRKPKPGIAVTKAERMAIIKAAITHYFPILLGVIFCFFIAMLVILLWLR